jgi:hypothetical protein
MQVVSQDDDFPTNSPKKSQSGGHVIDVRIGLKYVDPCSARFTMPDADFGVPFGRRKCTVNFISIMSLHKHLQKALPVNSEVAAEVCVHP